MPNTPRKLNISITGCRKGYIQDLINDMGLEPATKEIDGETVTGFNICVSGGPDSRKPRVTRDLGIFVTDKERAYEVVHGFVELYHEYGSRDIRARARNHFFVDGRGTGEIRDLLQGEYVDPELRPADENIRDEYAYNAGHPESDGRRDHIDVRERANSDYYVGLNVTAGRLMASDAVELTDIVDEYGSGEIRLTYRQNPS